MYNLGIKFQKNFKWGLEIERHAESAQEPEEYAYSEVVDLARQLNLEADKDDIQALLDSHNQDN